MIALPLLFFLLFHFQQNEPLKVYEARKLSDSLIIDGLDQDEVWSEAVVLTDFKLYWSDDIAQPTSFRAFWTNDQFYFLYNVIDDNIVPPTVTEDRGTIPTDRIEVFLQSNGTMNPYYCLEMGAEANTLAYVARHYRDFDYDWIWPENSFEVKASKTEDGYIVEGRISMESLRNLGVLQNENMMRVGLFRGDYFREPGKKSGVRWISWVDPQTKNPDFHVPSAFGQITLVQ